MDAWERQLKSSLEANPHELDLSQQKIGKEEVRILCRLLLKTQKLKELTIETFSLTNEGSYLFCGPPSPLFPHVSSLFVGAKTVATFLAKDKSLQKLSLKAASATNIELIMGTSLSKCCSGTNHLSQMIRDLISLKKEALL